MAELIFNGENAEAMDDFSVIPAANYNAQIVKSDIVPTKAKTGTRMNIQFKIIDGDFKGRIIFAGYNITNPNEQAVEISRKEIKSICDAIGKPNGIRDTNELHNIPLQIKVVITPADGKYAEKNEVKFYEAYEGVAVEGASAAQPTGETPAWAQ